MTKYNFKNNHRDNKAIARFGSHWKGLEHLRPHADFELTVTVFELFDSTMCVGILFVGQQDRVTRFGLFEAKIRNL